jgi:recombinational DNA repair protein RecR
MTSFDSLIRYFEKFPGIGGRQARRFVFHLLTLPPEERATFSELIKNVSVFILPL